MKPFGWFVVLLIVSNGLYSLFSAASIALFKPILEILFGESDVAAQEATGDTGLLTGLKDAFYGFIRDMVGEGDRSDTLMAICVLVILVFTFKLIFKYISDIVNNWVQEGIIKNIRDMLFAKLTSLDMKWFNNAQSGKTISLVLNDVGAMNQTLTPTLIALTREPIQIVVFLVLLVAMSPWLTLLAFSTSIISLVLIRVATKYLRKYAGRMQDAMADMTTVLDETLGGIRIIKSFVGERMAKERFASKSGAYYMATHKHKKVMAMVPGINEFLAIAALVVVLYYGGHEVFEGKLSGEDLMTFIVALFSIMAPIAKTVQIPTNIQRGLVAAKRVLAVIDEQPEIVHGQRKDVSFSEHISLDDCTFSYGGENVLKNVSVSINKGTKVALVGHSGSGKSTTIDLIVRFYDPISGAIKLDDTDIREFNIHSYRKLFGVVAQDPVLFNDTIANNIRFGAPEATEQEIRAAADTANATEFIEQFELGFETPIGDRGVLLSGGQKQRLAIARALVGNPQVLIFDEATSALDSQSERLVQQAINEALSERTAIIIAHRLSTIQECDEILVFDQGVIAERGTHAELLEHQGVYKHLHDVQFQEEN